MNLNLLKMIFEMMAAATVVLGIPVGLYQYRRSIKREQRDREYGTYDALDEKYLEFQHLCLSHPYLDVFDVRDKNPIRLNEQQKKEELIAFTLLFSIFERAYIMYNDQERELRSQQWDGWEEYIREYCSRQNFIDAWKTSGVTFDSRFQSYMRGRFNEFAPTANPAPHTDSGTRAVGA